MKITMNERQKNTDNKLDIIEYGLLQYYGSAQDTETRARKQIENNSNLHLGRRLYVYLYILPTPKFMLKIFYACHIAADCPISLVLIAFNRKISFTFLSEQASFLVYINLTSLWLVRHHHQHPYLAHHHNIHILAIYTPKGTGICLFINLECAY